MACTRMPTREKRGDKSTCRGVFSKQVLGMVGSVKDLFLCRHGACATKENLPDRSTMATESFSAVLVQDTPLGVLIGFRYGEAHSVKRCCAGQLVGLFFIDL